MQFLYPSFLWALLAISIPILIHLFHFRRFKNVYFPNIKFLKEIKEETSNRNKIRNLLVLLSRILAISALVLAFSQPFIPQSEDILKGSRSVSIFVDNSFSMNAQGEDIDLMNKAKLDAIKVVNAYENADRFQVMTHDFSFARQKWLNKEEAVENIEVIELTHDVKTMSQILRRQHASLEESNSENQVIYWISDFQLSTFDVDASMLDSARQYNAVYLSSVKNTNISIDSCWWVAPLPVKGQQGSLIVELQNFDNQDVEGLTINLNYNQQNYPLAKVDIPGNQSVRDTLRFTLNKAGWSEAIVSIKDYPVRFDDQYWISFEVAEKIPVLLISEAGINPYLQAVFESAGIFDLKYFPVSNIEYSGLQKYKLIIFDEIVSFSSGLTSSMESYIQNGGNVLMFPPQNIDLNNYNEFLARMNANQLVGVDNEKASVGRINEQEFVFMDVFDRIDRNISLPSSTMRYLTRERATASNRQILAFRDGRSYLDAYSIGVGHLYFSTVPLNIEINELVKQAEVFVPMVYRMALSSNINDRIAYVVGKDRLIRINRESKISEIPYRISGAKEFIPGMRNIGSMVQLDLQDQVEKEGIYTIMHEQDTIRQIAFNYDRKESDLACLTKEELEDRISPLGTIYNTSQTETDLTDSIVAKEKGLLLWKWFIILALVFLGVEILLLRLIKI